VSEFVSVTWHIHMRNMNIHTNDAYSYICIYISHHVAYVHVISEWISECDMKHSSAKHDSEYQWYISIYVYTYIYIYHITLHICMQLVSELVSVTWHIHMRNMTLSTNDACSYIYIYIYIYIYDIYIYIYMIYTYITVYYTYICAISERISGCDSTHAYAKHGSS